MCFWFIFVWSYATSALDAFILYPSISPAATLLVEVVSEVEFLLKMNQSNFQVPHNMISSYLISVIGALHVASCDINQWWNPTSLGSTGPFRQRFGALGPLGISTWMHSAWRFSGENILLLYPDVTMYLTVVVVVMAMFVWQVYWVSSWIFRSKPIE